MDDYDPQIHQKNLESIKELMDKIANNPSKIKLDDLMQSITYFRQSTTDDVTDQ